MPLSFRHDTFIIFAPAFHALSDIIEQLRRLRIAILPPLRHYAPLPRLRDADADMPPLRLRHAIFIIAAYATSCHAIAAILFSAYDYAPHYADIILFDAIEL